MFKLPPALLAEGPGSFTCYCGNTGGGMDTEVRVSTDSRPWKRKFSPRSCRDSNPQPFSHESGTLTTELFPSPIFRTMWPCCLFRTMWPCCLFRTWRQQHRHRTPQWSSPWCTRRSTWLTKCWLGSTSDSASSACWPSPCPTSTQPKPWTEPPSWTESEYSSGHPNTQSWTESECSSGHSNTRSWTESEYSSGHSNTRSWTASEQNSGHSNTTT